MPDLKETFEELKRYINDLPIGLLLFDSKKNLISWNKYSCEILNITNEDIKKNDLGITSTQIEELIEKVDLTEKELIGLIKPHKAKKILTSDNHSLVIITEAFQEAIGEMSHELRRPITNIKTLAESLLMGAKDDPDIASKFLNNINSEIDRLSRLVNDLLNISKIRAGKLQPTKKNLNLKERVQDAIKLLQPNAEKKSTTIKNETSDNFMIFADTEQLDHVIQNLIENAIKYSPDGSTITIKDGPISGSFEILDTGIGIAPEHLNKIFERFYQVDRSKAKGSSGLGLSIVKNIIDLHKGKIEVNSTLGKGSSFIVYLPVD